MATRRALALDIDNLQSDRSLLMRWLPSAAFWIVSVFIATLMMSRPAHGQIKYSPEHPVVKEMCQKAARYLSGNIPTEMGEMVLAAITVIEVSKRYEDTVPKDNPVVVRAVEEVLKELESLKKWQALPNPTNLPEIRAGGMYKLCLATIFLTDLNYDKYRAEVRDLVTYMMAQQMPQGGFGYTMGGNEDVSQSQYVGLALAVLKIHGHEVDAERAKRLLEWYCKTQLSGPEGEKGSWVYHYNNLAPATSGVKRSLHMTGAGSVYLLADFLNLTPTGVQGTKKRIEGIKRELPPSVREHFRDDVKRGDGLAPLASFDRGLLGRVKNAANQWLAGNFKIENQGKEWTYYYLYGLERYAYFREKSEGGMPEFPDWYDQGVEYLQKIQTGSGNWDPLQVGVENKNNSTCLATLFLVRSSQLLLKDPRPGDVVLNNDAFKENARVTQLANGVIKVEQETKGISDVLVALREGNSDEQLAEMSQLLAGPLKEFTARENKNKAETVGFLRGLVTEFDPFRRLVAVKFLAGLQDLDNVPALLYALGDPEMQIAVEAHNGLRLISRKLDSFPISKSPNEMEMKELKKKWTAWFLGIRPGANLLD